MVIVLGAVIVTFLVSVWIIVPAPVLPLMPFGVAAPEFSPVLLIVALLIGGSTLFAGKSRVKTAAVTLSVVTVAICCVPLVRVAMATQSFDRAIGVYDRRTHHARNGPGDRALARRDDASDGDDGRAEQSSASLG